MGLFHVKKGIPLAKAMPDKSTLKDEVSICLDFCSHERKCNLTHLLCKNGKHYTNWKNVPDDNKMTLLKHMSATGLMWLNAEMFTKHGILLLRSSRTYSATRPVPGQKRMQQVRKSQLVLFTSIVPHPHCFASGNDHW